AASQFADDLLPRQNPEIIRIRFPLLNYMEFSFRKFQLGKQTPRFISIQINNGDWFARRVTKLASDQQCREMIARWHVPFACADKDSGLLVRRHAKIPSLVFNGIRS